MGGNTQTCERAQAPNTTSNGGDASRVGIEIGVKYKRNYC